MGCRLGSGTEPTLRLGEEACAECHMLIGEPRFTAAYRTREGLWRKFDDLGCLVRFRSRQPEGTERIFVHDYQGDGWLDAEGAFFVHSPRLATPMGYGLVALATEEAARRLASTLQGEVLRFPQLPQALKVSTSNEEEVTP